MPAFTDTVARLRMQQSAASCRCCGGSGRVDARGMSGRAGRQPGEGTWTNCSSREPCSRSFQRATRRSRRRDNGPAAYFFVEFWSILALKLVPLPGKFWCGRNNWGMSVLGSIRFLTFWGFARYRGSSLRFICLWMRKPSTLIFVPTLSPAPRAQLI